MFTTTMAQPDPRDFMRQFLSCGGRRAREQVAGPQYHTLAQRRIRRALSRIRRRARSGQAGGAVYQDERPGDQERSGHPRCLPPERGSGSAKLHVLLVSGWDNDYAGTSMTGMPMPLSPGREPARTPSGRRGRSRRLVLRYFVRRLLLAVPSLRHQYCAVRDPCARPGRPFRTSPPIPSFRPRSPPRCAQNSASTTRFRYATCIGSSRCCTAIGGSRSPAGSTSSTLILQRLPTTLIVIGASQILALFIAVPVGVYAGVRPYSIFDQIASSAALIGFSLPTFFTGLVFILLFSINLHWLPFVYRTDIGGSGLALVLVLLPPSDHAGCGARPLSRSGVDALCARFGAGRGPPRLRHDRTRQGAV